MPLLHVATLPTGLISRYVPALRLSDDLVVSIFSPYSATEDSYIEKAINEGGIALAYRPGDVPVDGYGNPIAPAKLISVVDNPADYSEENGIAKIAGLTAWVQDEGARDGMIYVLQINNSRLNKAATHKSILVGGIGYLLLKNEIVDNDLHAGDFVIQTS